jgi:hypothetical protein
MATCVTDLGSFSRLDAEVMRERLREFERSVLERACKAICTDCAHDVPATAAPEDLSTFFHRLLDGGWRCKASSIRALRALAEEL